MDGLRELGARRLVQPRRPRPGDRPASAPGRSPRGARRPSAQAAIGAALGVARAGAADERPPGADPGADAAGRWWPLQEFMIRRARRGPDRRTWSSATHRAARADSRGARGDRGCAGDRHRPLEPGHLDRPDPGGPRPRRRDPGERRAGRRGQPARRAERCSRARPRPVLRVGRPDARQRRDRRAPTRR